MKAVSFTRNGAARDVLEYGTLPDPEPAAHEMRVRIAFSGINPSDVKRRSGASNVLAFERAVPNMDGSGIVDRVGEAIDRAWIGKRVWLHKTGWERPYGTAAEYALSAPDRAFELPSVVSFEAGAALGVPAMTAHRALFCDGPIDGKTVLVTGGAGLVGFYAIQLAKWGGAARVISTVSSVQKADLAKLAGADIIVNYRTENTVEAVLQATGGKGVDHIVDVDFGANLADTLRVIAPYGVVSAYASAAVPNPAIPFRELMAKNVKLVPFLVYSMAPDAIAAAGRDVNAWLAAGKARHNIAKRFSLEQLADAHLAVEAGEVGKVVVEVAGENLAL